MSLNDLKTRVAQAAATPTANADTGAEVATTDSDAAVDVQGPTQPAIPDHALQDALWIWLKGYRGYWSQLLPDHVSPNAFEAAAFTTLANSKQFAEIIEKNHRSFVYALAMCAHFGLMPDGVQAAIVPYGKSCTFVPMYRGYITLMLRYKVLKSVHFDFIRDGDTYNLDKGTGEFSHKPDLLRDEDDREPLVAYVYGRLPDGDRTEVVTMSRKRAHAIRDEYSSSYKSAERARTNKAADFKSNPWKDEYHSPWHDEEESMWLKSCVRLFVKRLDLTPPALAELVGADTDDSTPGHTPIVPGRVMQALTAPATTAVPGQPHAYVHNESSDPYCGLEGCEAYHDDPIHQT